MVSRRVNFKQIINTWIAMASTMCLSRWHVDVSCNWLFKQLLNMEWTFLLSSWDTEGILNGKSNWTSPFFNNVAQKFNNSLAGPQILKESSYDSTAAVTEQTLVFLPVLITFLVKQFFSKDVSDAKLTKISLSWPQFFNLKIIFYIISYAAFGLVFPLLTCMLVFSFLNRQIVKTILKVRNKGNFVKLLDGTDAIWAVEEDNAKSVINVIATVQGKKNQVDEELLEKLRRIVQLKFLTRPHTYPKMLYNKSYGLGYYYWENNHDIKIEDFIRPMNTGNEDLTKENLYKIVSDLSNTDLPLNNKATWEILVGTNPLKQNENGPNYINRYPLMFRIHHSLGDGVVLMKLLLKILADEGKTNIKRQMSIIIPVDDLKTSVRQLFRHSNLKKCKESVMSIFKTTCKVISILLMVPPSLIRQLTRPPDDNILHGKGLEGDKVCVWLKESDIGEGILCKIKKMKNRIHGSTFSDLFLTALSASYFKYFSRQITVGKGSIPNDMTAIVPVRVEQSDLNLKQGINDSASLKLENKFTVAMLTIPIKVGNKTDADKVMHLKRLMEVRKQTNYLRSSADFYVNYFIMSLVGHVFPEPLLRPMLKSEQASLVVSNLPGPSNVTICGGHKIKDMAFFVPHRGTTGMGVTLLTFDGRVNLGLMADKAIMGNVKDAENILREALLELETLDVITSKMMHSSSNSFKMHT